MAELAPTLREQLDRTPPTVLLDYLADRLGPETIGRRLAGESLPPDTRSLAELLAERLDLSVGVCRIEMQLEDGRLVNLWRHERIGATALWRYDAPVERT